jgi:HTH-type transcriptional regulator/antitoxin HigA
MQKRGWIPETRSIDELSGHLKRFFGVASLEGEIEFPIAMRMSGRPDGLNSAQRAWCFRARQLAASLIPNPFKPERLRAAKDKLRKLAAYRNEACHVPELMNDLGVRFVVVEPLPRSRIDGAAFWIDGSPVVAISIRYDRHDYFWFTLVHEFMHIANNDAISVDDDLGREGDSLTLLKDDVERRADEQAADLLISNADLESFIRRVGPLYSQDRIVQFAHSVKMHPSIVVGQLQARGEIGWQSHRPLLSKIRDIILGTALTDGWGFELPADLS